MFGALGDGISVVINPNPKLFMAMEMGFGNGNSHANLTCNVSGKMFIYELNHLTHSYGNGPFLIYRCYILLYYIDG